jgi:hypothetical protein
VIKKQYARTLESTRYFLSLNVKRKKQMLRKLTAAFIVIAALTLSHVAAIAQETAGVVEKIRGEAFQLAGGTNKPLSVGAAIHAGDLVTTGDDARLLIRFLDQSTLTMGEKAQMAIDEMVYVPAGRNPERGEQTLKFVTGVFRLQRSVFAVPACWPVNFRSACPWGSRITAFRFLKVPSTSSHPWVR